MQLLQAFDIYVEKIKTERRVADRKGVIERERLKKKN